jgi:predicted sugar kinase
MQANKYIKLEHSQKNAIKKNLLYSEMGLLNTLKNYKMYKKLKKQELALKKLLKKVVSQIKGEISNFEKMIPKINENSGKTFTSSSGKKRDELQDEINIIKRKIQMLSD